MTDFEEIKITDSASATNGLTQDFTSSREILMQKSTYDDE